MGCTSSKENTNPPSTTTLTDNNQQLINEQFRKWLKSNRPQADEYVLNDIILTTKQSNNIDDYRPIVSKALDLLSNNLDIKTINKLNKLVQKEVSLASPKKVAHTIDVLKQTAEKLRHGQIIFDNNQEQTATTATSNGEITKTTENKHDQISSGGGEPGIALKEALEKARVLFYKGKQAAIFASPSGGYDVRIIDDNDDVLKQDGNLLRSIIVTEVKMRPKPIPTTNLPHFTAPPPPPPSTKLLDEHEIGDDFRRSIDAALKGLEAIYQTSPSEHSQEAHIINLTDIQPKVVDNTNENSLLSHDDIERREKNLASSLANKDSISSSQQKIKLSNENRPKSFDETNRHLPRSTNKIQDKSLTSTEEYNKTLSESLLTPVNSSLDNNNPPIKSPSHNVTYTEIIHSESRDGEQSRRFITESYDELPSNDDEQTTTLKVVTKSEFSNHPSSGEKIMEQSVQVITVKVRNETKTTSPSHTSDNEISYDKQSIKNDTNTIDMIT